MKSQQTLVLGGARSGKSRFAQQLALESALPVTCIVTATAEDAEMQRRIERHRQQRPATWELVEEPLALAQAMERHARADRYLLIDCLTLWLSNCLLHDDVRYWEDERDALLRLFPSLPGVITLVSNETGMGVVPMGELSRRFCDEAGWLHQVLAQQCDRVILTVAGLPQILKGDAT